MYKYQTELWDQNNNSEFTFVDRETDQLYTYTTI